MSPELTFWLEKARAMVDAMSPEEYRQMIDAQRESWIRAFAPCEHGMVDFEECVSCRNPE